MGRRIPGFKQLLSEVWVGMDSAHAIRHGAPLSRRAHRHIEDNRAYRAQPPRDPLQDSFHAPRPGR